MLSKQKIKALIKKIVKFPLWILIPSVIVLFLAIIYLVEFLNDKSVTFSYNSSTTCVQQLIFLPGLSKNTSNISDFSIKNEDVTKLGDLQLFSSKTCFVAKKSPSVGETKLSVALFGGWFARKTFKIAVPQPPILDYSILIQPISIVRPLVVALNSADLVFNYQIEVDNKVALCPIKALVISCDVASLHLLQGKNYEMKLIRRFGNQKVATLVKTTIKTIEAATITSASIIQYQIIYDNPKTFTFDFNKAITKGNIKLEKIDSASRMTVATTVIFNDKQATITLKNNLERSSSYELSIDQIEAIDGSTLVEPYVLDFAVSGGPSVTAVNVGTISTPLTQTIILTFDQTLFAGQDVTKFVSTSGIPTEISKSDNQVFISYSNAPICTELNIQVNPGIQNNYGIVQNDSWFFKTRTICHATSIIGYSVERRPIIAYTFGSGNQAELYTGSIHGNELSTKYLMDAWVNELEINIDSIPTDKTIIVIPTLNPDGVVADRRSNSNNVDLNRNFPTVDWQTDIVSPTNQPIPGGGGVSTLSEPESQAIAAFTAQVRPRLTMSFHSEAGYVIANQASDSIALATAYAQLSGYTDMTGVSGGFSYPITGTYDDWIREAIGTASVLVELSSNTNSEFSRNVAALWAMVRS